MVVDRKNKKVISIMHEVKLINKQHQIMKQFYQCLFSVGRNAARGTLLAAALFLAGSAVAQSHIKITPAGTTYTNSPAIKFYVGWNNIPQDGRTHNTKIWVFIDYLKVENHRDAGNWTRATIAGISAGTLEPGGQGFWLQGNTGAYNQEVTVTLSGMPPKFKWCVFATDFPPVAEFTNSNNIRFHGSAPFTITYSDQSVAGNLPKTSYTPLQGKKIKTVTDATGCPGMVKYTMTAPALNGGGSYCAASATLTCPGEAGISYQLHRNGAATGAVQSGTGSVLTWTVTNSGSYMLSATHTATASTAAGNQAVLAFYEAPTAPTGLVTSATTICPAIPTPSTLTAIGGSKGAGAVYEWGTGTTPGSNPLNPATTTANTYAVTPNGAVNYWVRLAGNTACKNKTAAATVAVTTYAPFTAGGITSDTTFTKAGINPNDTVQSSTDASGGGHSISYQWRRSGTNNATLTGSAATYALHSDSLNYAAMGTYSLNRYAKNDVCNTGWVASGGTHVLIVNNPDPDQGACWFPKPPPLMAFPDFPSSYSASTYVTLTDDRDGHTYVVIKIGSIWIMAQNLNYQDNLTWLSNSQSSSPSGVFWCPSRNQSSTSSDKLTCNVWGALYNWETAMMVDGQWRDENKNSTTWVESICTRNVSSSNTNNGGLGATKRGICPRNWHVPTDEEWGRLLNEMETGTKNHNVQGNWVGTDAGARAKSRCACPDSKPNCAAGVDNLWHYNAAHAGTDKYGFRVLPTGIRYYDGSYFKYLGWSAFFWSSSCSDLNAAWLRNFDYDRSAVFRGTATRLSGFSVRCVRD
jgi:uncharacterized protein (TIGR02145 family)